MSREQMVNALVKRDIDWIIDGVLRNDHSFLWDVLTGDFDRRRTAEECWEATAKALRPGSIVVMHDSDKAGPRLEGLLPRLLAHLDEKGWRSEAIPMPGKDR